jgi:hypothetical protein
MRLPCPWHFPHFLLEQKRRERIQKALGKEAGWNHEGAGPEQGGGLSVGRDVWYTTDCQTQPCGTRSRHSSPEDEYMVKWPSVVYSLCYHPDLLQQNSARASAERVTKRAAKTDLRAVCPECVNPNIIMAKIPQLSWRATYPERLAHQDNCCKSNQFNVGIYNFPIIYSPIASRSKK